MPTLKEVKAMVKGLGKDTDTFGTKKEIKYLPEILKEDERILALTSGLMDGNTWLITCTNKRIIFLDKGLIYGLKQVETPLDKINSIESKTGIFFGEIGVWDGASKMEIKQVMKQTVKPFTNIVNQAIEDLKNGNNANNSNAPAKVGISEEIKKFASLRDDGILSDDEFQIKKKQLLSL